MMRPVPRFAHATRILIAGVSARAVAESAERAGYDVVALDGFGDLDLRARVRALSLPADFGVAYDSRAAGRIARGVPSEAAVYASGFENHPAAVAALADGRTLWGNGPAVLARVRDPRGLAQALAARGIAVPAMRASAPSGPSLSWLLKPRASGGGHGVEPWSAGARVPRRAYLQQRIDGAPASIVFVADGRRAVPLALTRQLVGEPAFGASGFHYCGSLLTTAGDAGLAHDGELFARAAALAQAVVDEFGLVGVNGVDFIAADGVPFPIEVNPRFSASMELAERAYGVSVFDAHARACALGALPSFDLRRARQASGAYGKAVVFARCDVVLGDTRHWLEDDDVRDVPHPGERIASGRPVCTVFARGRDAAECHAALVRHALRVYDEIERRARRSA